MYKAKCVPTVLSAIMAIMSQYPTRYFEIAEVEEAELKAAHHEIFRDDPAALSRLTDATMLDMAHGPSNGEPSYAVTFAVYHDHTRFGLYCVLFNALNEVSHVYYSDDAVHA